MFPSWNVPISNFEYFDGERTMDKGIPIEMTANQRNSSVMVTYALSGFLRRCWSMAKTVLRR